MNAVVVVAILEKVRVEARVELCFSQPIMMVLLRRTGRRFNQNPARWDPLSYYKKTLRGLGIAQKSKSTTVRSTYRASFSLIRVQSSRYVFLLDAQYFAPTRSGAIGLRKQFAPSEAEKLDSYNHTHDLFTFYSSSKSAHLSSDSFSTASHPQFRNHHDPGRCIYIDSRGVQARFDR